MTKPIPDKAEVAVEYPDKLYIGTFERTARFDAHLDEAGISLSLRRIGTDNGRKSVRMHFHYELAKTVAALPPAISRIAKRFVRLRKRSISPWKTGQRGCDGNADLTPEDAVRLLHILE